MEKICNSKEQLRKTGNIFRLLFQSSEEFEKNVIKGNTKYPPIDKLKTNFENSSNFLIKRISGFEELNELLNGARDDVNNALNEVHLIEELKEDLMNKETNAGYGQQLQINDKNNFVFSSQDSVQNLTKKEQNCLQKMSVLNKILEYFYEEKLIFLKKFRKLIKSEFKGFFSNFRKVWKKQINSIPEKKDIEKEVIIDIKQENISKISKTSSFSEDNYIIDIQKKPEHINNNFLTNIDQTPDLFFNENNLEKDQNNNFQNETINKEPFPPLDNQDLLTLDIDCTSSIDKSGPLHVESREIIRSSSRLSKSIKDDNLSNISHDLLLNSKPSEKNDENVPFNNLYMVSKNSISDSLSSENNENNQKIDQNQSLVKSKEEIIIMPENSNFTQNNYFLDNNNNNNKSIIKSNNNSQLIDAKSSSESFYSYKKKESISCESLDDNENKILNNDFLAENDISSDSSIENNVNKDANYFNFFEKENQNSFSPKTNNENLIDQQNEFKNVTNKKKSIDNNMDIICLLYTSPSPRD